MEARQSDGGPGGISRAWTASFALDRMLPGRATLRTRHTRYLTPVSSGWLHSGALGLDPKSWLHLELNGGIRHDLNASNDPPDTRIAWIGSDFDLSLGRSWYLLASATHQTGGTDGYDEVYLRVTWRF